MGINLRKDKGCSGRCSILSAADVKEAFISGSNPWKRRHHNHSPNTGIEYWFSALALKIQYFYRLCPGNRLFTLCAFMLCGILLTDVQLNKFLLASKIKGFTLKSMKHLLISATFPLLFLSSCNTRHGRIFEKKSSYTRNLCHWGQIGLSSINLDWFIWLPPMNISFSARLFPKPLFHV